MNKGHTEKVLDQGYVKLINFMGSDEEIVEAARMSTGRGFISWEPYARCKKCDSIGSLKGGSILFAQDCLTGGHESEKFPAGDMGMLDRLWRNKHATPFECGGEIVIEVQAPIMVFREWHRHRTQSYNEFSARYAQMPNLHYLPSPTRIQKQSTTNKQGSGEQLQADFQMEVLHLLADEQQQVYKSYDDFVEKGVAKEIARINTPVSRYSKMRAKTDIRNWLAFLNLRMRPSAQWEIRQYANIVGGILKALFPRTWELFEEYDLYGAHMSRSELMALRGSIIALLGGSGSEPTEADLKNLSSFTRSKGMVWGLEGSKITEFEQKILKGGKEILG